ncbi:ribosome biogenesis GTPase Der [Buchnera aphidicola]|uniref:ribosome biogenesis GTPase Der n=1 Tax=Buchnera aphidicola TaxID=9 RepID=UPI0031B82FD0
MTFKISLIGRENVGKSTLFNILTKNKDALTDNTPGLTRDRKYGYHINKKKKIIFIDTAGIKKTKKIINIKAIKNTKKAILESKIIFFIVNIQEGLTWEDYEISNILNKFRNKTYLIINKVDNKNLKKKKIEFYNLGFKNIFLISSIHKNGINILLKNIYKKIKNKKEKKKKNIYISIIGKPNVGKSTLGNKILKKKQFITDNSSGTTRDSISIIIKKKKIKYFLTDTAGICKKKNIKNKITMLSILKSFNTIKKSNIVIFLLDIKKNRICNQDFFIAKKILKYGNFVLIVINKSDKFSEKFKKKIKKIIFKKFKFFNLSKLFFISALYNQGIEKLLKNIFFFSNILNKKFSSKFLNKILKKAITKHQPPIHKNIRIKPKYVNLINIKPYTIIIHGNKISKLPISYKNYLKFYFQKKMKLNNYILKIFYRENKNPYKNN